MLKENLTVRCLIASSLQSFETYKNNLSTHCLKSESLIKFVGLIDYFSRKINNRIALIDKFLMIAAHHCLRPSFMNSVTYT
jgi:hypothetical protein